VEDQASTDASVSVAPEMVQTAYVYGTIESFIGSNGKATWLVAHGTIQYDMMSTSTMNNASHK
jgi:hypothetical protein